MRNTTTFNLDEYYPMDASNPQVCSPFPIVLFPLSNLHLWRQSYRAFMQRHLFEHIDIDEEHTHVPDGRVPLERVPSFCREYEDAIGLAGG